MKRIHVLRVSADSKSSDFDALTTAAKGRGLRVGRLDWRPEQAPEEAAPVPGGLDGTMLRHVRLEQGLATSWKPMAGAPVLGDVLREYFRGCSLVLVQSEGALPEDAAIGSLERLEDDSYRVRVDGELAKQLDLTADELARRLPRPRPFDD